MWKASARLTAATALALGAAGGVNAQAAAEPPAGAWARTAFVWAGEVLLAESERPREDALAAVYVYEPGSFRPLAVAKRDAHGAPAAVYRYHLDHLGTPQELADAQGRVAWSAEYRAWGAAAGDSVAVVSQPLRLQGQYADTETGLHYNRFRYYSPAEGRFVSQDPIRLAGGEHLTAYAPSTVTWVDPLGLSGFKTVDFTGHPDLYPATGTQRNTVQIPLQGTRPRDFTVAFQESGIPRADAKGYTWHHVADFDPQTGTSTMQLVK